MPPDRLVVSHHVQRWHRHLVPARDGRVELLHRMTGERRNESAEAWHLLETVLRRPRTRPDVIRRGVDATFLDALVQARFVVDPLHDCWDDFIATPDDATTALVRDRLRWSRDVIDPHGLWMYPRWMGVRALQWPPDLWAMQELLFALRPSFVVETGLFEGGGALYYASVFELLGAGHVVAVERHLRPDAKARLAEHPLSKRLTVLEGDSADPAIVAEVSRRVGGPGNHVVALDSDHSETHVLRELEAYAPLVDHAGRIVVFDTSMSLVPAHAASNPHRAVKRFLASQAEAWRLSPWGGAAFTTACEDGVLERYPDDAGGDV